MCLKTFSPEDISIHLVKNKRNRFLIAINDTGKSFHFSLAHMPEPFKYLYPYFYNSTVWFAKEQASIYKNIYLAFQ